MMLSFLIDAPVALAEDDGVSSWVQIAKTGTFSDPRYGKFSITTREFSKWISNFKQMVLDKGRVGLPADVDHSPEKKGETEAAGWIKQLEQRADELWARVEWNTLGQELIREKRYAYISPSYNPSFKDETGKDHGTTLVGIALTNRPFLQMATVNLSQFTFADDGPVVKDDNDPDDLDDATMDDILDISDPARQKYATVTKTIAGTTKHMFPLPPGDKVHAAAALRLLPKAVAAGHITEDEADQIKGKARSVLGGKQLAQEAYTHRQMELTTVLTTFGVTLSDLGLDDTADEATVLAAIKERQTTPPAPEPGPGQVILSAEQVQTLTAQAAAGQAAAEELRVSRFESTFDRILSEGKAVPAQKESFREMYDLNGEKTLKLLDGLQPVVNMIPQGHGVAPSDVTPQMTALAAEYSDSVTPMGVDPAGLQTLAQAEALAVTRKIPFEEALTLVEQGVTV